MLTFSLFSRPLIGSFLMVLGLLGVLVPTMVDSAAQGPASSSTAMREAFANSYRYERSQNYADAINALMVLKEKGYLYELRMGWLYYLTGNFANSRQHYQAAITAAPAAIEPRLGMMLPLMAQLRYDEVEAVAKPVLMSDPNNFTANLRLCMVLRYQQKNAQALEIASRMLRLYPTDLNFLAEQGLLQAAEGETEAAKKTFGVVLTLDPENVSAKTFLADNP